MSFSSPGQGTTPWSASLFGAGRAFGLLPAEWRPDYSGGFGPYEWWGDPAQKLQDN